MTTFRPCVLIPLHDDPRTIRDVALAARAIRPQVVVDDDASGAAETHTRLVWLRA